MTPFLRRWLQRMKSAKTTTPSSSPQTSSVTKPVPTKARQTPKSPSPKKAKTEAKK